MKIQCDVCNKDPASVFCTADEAALCNVCDNRVHHANKFASKHQRFPLLHSSSPDQVPLCDICQEKRAFLFCVQDRAILCQDCDVPIHSANEHTEKHDRFLLAGFKLSALYNSSSSSSIASLSKDGDSVPESESQPLVDDPFSVTKASSITATANNSGDDSNLLASEICGSIGSISEYMIEMLPGWHVEDFLDSGFSKTDDDMLPYFDADLESNTSTFSPESLELWVPQQPPSTFYAPQNPSQTGGQIGFKERKEITGTKAERRWTGDGFTVPEIISSSIGSKRFKPHS